MISTINTEHQITTSVMHGVPVSIDDTAVEESDVRIVVTRDAWREARDALAEAQAAVRDLTAAAESGALDVADVEQLTRAEATAGHLASIATGRRREYDAAKREAVTADVGLGVALAPLLAEALGGVEVVVQNHRPDTFPEASKLPSLVIVQQGPHVADPISGGLAGRVVAWFLRSDLHTPMTDTRVRAILDDLERSASVRATVRSETPPVRAVGDGIADRVPLDVRHTMPHTPIIAHAPSAPTVASFIDRVIDSAWPMLSISDLDPFGRRRYHGTLHVDRPTATIDAERVNAQGVRETVVSAIVHAAGRNGLRRDDTPAVVLDAARSEIGRTFPEMGRLTKMDVIAQEPPNGPGPMPMIVRCTIVSALPTQ